MVLKCWLRSWGSILDQDRNLCRDFYTPTPQTNSILSTMLVGGCDDEGGNSPRSFIICRGWENEVASASWLRLAIPSLKDCCWFSYYVCQFICEFLGRFVKHSISCAILLAYYNFPFLGWSISSSFVWFAFYCRVYVVRCECLWVASTSVKDVVRCSVIDLKSYVRLTMHFVFFNWCKKLSSTSKYVFLLPVLVFYTVSD